MEVPNEVQGHLVSEHLVPAQADASIQNGSAELLQQEVGPGVGDGVGPGVGPPVGPGVRPEVGSGVDSGAGPGVGPEVGPGVGPGVPVGADVVPVTPDVSPCSPCRRKRSREPTAYAVEKPPLEPAEKLNRKKKKAANTPAINPRIKMVGGETMGMCVISPEPNHPALKIIAKLGKLIQTQKYLTQLHDFIQNNGDGIAKAENTTEPADANSSTSGGGGKPRKSWEERMKEMWNFFLTNGHTKVSAQGQHKKLGRWLSAVRCRIRDGLLPQHHVKEFLAMQEWSLGEGIKGEEDTPVATTGTTPAGSNHSSRRNSGSTVSHDNNTPLESARMIQGNRYEVFLSAREKTSKAFDTIFAPHLPTNAKRIILDYARKQARKDPRIGINYQFGNFSLLISGHQSPQQKPHMDLVHPNYQFLMPLTSNAPGTHFVPESKAVPIRTIEDLAQLWEQTPKFQDAICKTVPPNIVEAFKGDGGSQQLLDYFGDTLSSETALKKNFYSEKNVPVGTVAALPGSVVHAGPASKKPRAVLFFSGSDRRSDMVDEYIPDSQYNGLTLMGHFVSILWRRDGVTTYERKYLLRKLVQYVNDCSGKDVSAQFGDGKMKEFVYAIQGKSYLEQGMTLDEFIRVKSMCLEMPLVGDPYSEVARRLNPEDYELISTDDGLFTVFEEDGEKMELPVMVYRRKPNGKIVIRYLTEGTGGDEYEGNGPKDNYRLEMEIPGSEEKFDGSNGKIFTQDNEEIVIYKKEGRQRAI